MNTGKSEPPQPEPSLSQVRLPVPITPAHPQASERAPTLMAGATPGKQGQVTVWAPSIWQIRLMVAAVLFMLILTGVASMSPHLRYFHLLKGLLYTLLVAGSSFSLWLRPRYITTDDAGIGITTRKGSCALRWNEIHSLFQHSTGDCILNSGNKAINLDLLAHTPKKRRELADLIIEKADLRKHPNRRGFYERWMFPSQRAASPALTAPGGASAPSTDESSLSHSEEGLPGEVPRWAQAHRH